MEAKTNKEALVHCIYSSAETTPFSQKDIATLLGKARFNNDKLGVTGMLLYDNGSFFQILEGQPETVTLILDEIQKDQRHNHIVKIIHEEIEERNFSDWTMGYSGVTREDLKSIEGLNDFFLANKQYTELDEGRAKTLLKAFKEGKWRATIS